MLKKLIILSYVVAVSLLGLVGLASHRIHQRLDLRHALIDESAARQKQIEVLLGAMNEWSAAASLAVETESFSELRLRSSRMKVWRAFLGLEPHYHDDTIGTAEIAVLREQFRILNDGFSTPTTSSSTINGMILVLSDLAGAEEALKESAGAKYRKQAHEAVKLLAGFVIVVLAFLLCAIIVAHREMASRAVFRTQLKRTNAQLEERIAQQERRATELELLSGLGEQLQVCSNLDESRPVITSYLPILFPSSQGAVYFSRESDDSPELLSDWGFPTASPRVVESSECLGMKSGRMHHSGPGRPSIPCSHVSDPARSSICVPMHGDGESLGVLHLVFPIGEAPDEQLGKSVTEQLSLCLSNIRLRETLRLRAIRDPLTGLYNRRYLEESLSREVQRAARQRSTFAVVMVDVDHFKAFNDTFGHAAGDVVLKALAELMQSHVRQEDVVCRFGGEEFTLLLTDTSLEAARDRLEELRAKVKELGLEHDGTNLGRVTISAGLSAYPQHGQTLDKLISVADRMVYRAKLEGRDRIVLADEPGEGGTPVRALRIVEKLESA
jgi:diguanylate cyclase (GGDEF)-like protein